MFDDSQSGKARRRQLQEAIRHANIPTLACVLVHLTGERSWIEGRFVPDRTRGLDDNDSGGLPEAVQEEIRNAAFDAISAHMDGAPIRLPNPSDALLVEMMSVSLGDKIPFDYAPMIREGLQLDEPAESDRAKPPAGFHALIIGAGISGLCAAKQFKDAGIDYTILERSRQIGGVWTVNRYPGAACDVPSHLYSFSFASYDWSRYFAGRAEIHRYLEKVADDLDIRRHIIFDADVTSASYDEANRKWIAKFVDADGRARTLAGDIVISAVGAFNKPKIPNIPGRDTFKGESAHTAEYPDSGIDLRGKRVIVVGNGASAMQLVPAIADEVSELTVVQRSRQWVAPFPKFKQSIPPSLRWLLNEVALYRLWYRMRLSWAFNDKLYEALQRDLVWEEGRQSVNPVNESHRRGLIAYAREELKEAPELIDELIPDYPPFGKRMLLDNGWFRTLARDNVRLVSGGVTQVREHSVVIDGSEEIAADVIIWATGFDVVHLIAPMEVYGRAGHRLHDDWDGDDAKAYLGTVVPNYPNFFCLYGPNTQFGHGGSLITVLERQMHYVMLLLNAMFANGIATLDVSETVYDAYNRKVDELHEGMIWQYPGIDNYTKNSKGRVIVNNPFRILDVWRMTQTADLENFRSEKAGDNIGKPPLVADNENG